MRIFKDHFNLLNPFIVSLSLIHAQIPINPVLWLDAAVGISQNAANQVSEWNGKNNQYKAFQDIEASQATYIPASIGNLSILRFICIQIKPILI